MKRTSQADIWLRSWQRSKSVANVRLVIFPHAGGAASFYRDLSEVFPSTVDACVVQYPGREDRFNDPFAASLPALAENIVKVLLTLPELPLVLFGHSMGAILAYEVAMRLEKNNGLIVHHLFVSGRRAPGISPGGNIHQRDDEGLLAELAGMGGTPRALLQQMELRALVLPAVRDDYRLIETYTMQTLFPLSCSIGVCSGDIDIGADDMMAWSDYTRSSCSLHFFPGNHFYLLTQCRQLAEVIMTCFSRWGP